MQKRNPITVALLILVTFGIYGIVWQVKTKGEMKSKGADIPTAWLLIVPIVSIYWLWKYSVGVEKVTNGKISAILSFLLLYLLGFIGAAIIQDSFNNLDAAVATATPTADTPAITEAETAEKPSQAPSEVDAPATPAVPETPATIPSTAATPPTAPAESTAPTVPTDTPAAPKV